MLSTQLFVYAGQRRAANGKGKALVQLFRVPEKNAYTLGEPFSFEPKHKASYNAFSVVGGVYRIEVPDENPETILTNSAMLVDRWPNAAQVAEWNALHGSVRLAQNVAKLESTDVELLDQLQRAYRRLPGPARGVFLARVINHITRAV